MNYMVEKSEEQLDFFQKMSKTAPKPDDASNDKRVAPVELPKKLRPKIFKPEDLRKIFGPDHVSDAGEQAPNKPESIESILKENILPRKKFRPPYPRGYDGNPD